MTLLGTIGFSIRTYGQLIEADRWNIHTYKVLLQIRGLNETLFNYDMALRAYANTREPRFFQDLQENRRAFDQGLQAMFRLTEDRPTQQRRLEDLRGKFQNYLRQQAEPLINAARNAASTEASIRESVRRAVPRRLALESTRQVIADMEEQEQTLLAQRQMEQEGLQSRTLWALWLGALFSILLVAGLMVGVGAGAREIAQSNARLERANRHLGEANDKLEEFNTSLAQANAGLETANTRLASVNHNLESEVLERKKAQEQLNQAVEDLERSNSDLEQFAYVASHDLQEPLRAVSGCVQVLKRRYEGQLDERADQLINHAVDGAQRMQTLINDLLAYSRVGTRGAPFTNVSMQGVMDRVRRNLSVSLQESGAELECEALMPVWGDAGQLEQLLQNLLSNSLKFVAKRPPRVEISNCLHGDMVRFAVRDYGPGIAPQYFERIFVMFQRLHTRSEYPGTGIGLAISKKIVERHGGTIWVESQEGQGTTFFFEIPAAHAVSAENSPLNDEAPHEASH